MKTLTLRTKLTAVFVAIATVAAVSFTVDNSFAQRGRGGGPGFGGPGFGGHGGPGGEGFGGGFRRGPGGPGGQKGQRGGPEGMILRHAEEIGLSDEQVDQIKAVIASSTETVQAHREEMKRLQDALRDAVTSDSPDENIIREIASQIGTAIGDGAVIKVSVHQSILAVLTDAQEAQLEELKAEREALREKMEELRSEAEELGLGGDRPERGFGRGERRGGRR